MKKLLALFLLISNSAYAVPFDTITVEGACNLPSLTASRVIYLDGSNNIQTSSVTSTTLLYLDATSSIQTQLNGKQALLGYTAENVANKATDLTSPDNVKYPTTLAVANAIAAVPAGVTSFNSRTGAVTPQSGDYNTSQVTENTNLYFTTARAQASISSSSPLTYSTGVVGCQTSSGSQAGCLSSTDWTTFNGKQSALTIGNLTDAGTDGITVTGGTGSVIGSGTSFSQHVADTTHNGYTSSTDWNTFNGKQAALGFTPENVANKSTNLTSPDNTKYPTTLAVSNAIAAIPTITIGALDSQSENANGLAIVSGALSTQSADATHPGVINNTTQALSGDKNFSGNLSAATITTSSTGNTGAGQLTAIVVNPTAPYSSYGQLTFDQNGPTGGFSWWQRTLGYHYMTFHPSGFGGEVIIGGNSTANEDSSLEVSAGPNAKGISVYNSGTNPGDMLSLRASDYTTILARIDHTGKIFGTGMDAGSNKINNVSDPSAAQDAATKNYVDSSVAALQPQDSCYVATVGSNIAGTYSNGVAGVGATFTTTATGTFTLDGITPPLGVRVLIKDQTSGFQNGIYSITTLGTVGVSTVFTRTSDYNTAADMNAGGLTPVINGTLNALSSWQQVATITTVGTDALVFSEFTANPSLYLLKANNLSDVSSKTTAFNNLSPMTTIGDIIYGGASGTGTRLAGGTTGQTLTANTGSAPTWTTPTASVSSIGSLDAQTANANGLALVSGVLSAQSATASFPGLVNNTTQTFSGNKTFGNLIAGGFTSLTDSSYNIGATANRWNVMYVNTLRHVNAGAYIDLTNSFLNDGTITQLGWSTAGVQLPQVTANTVPYLNGSAVFTASSVTPTELGYVHNVTSAIQTQLNAKQATLTLGNLTDAGTDGITVTGGTGAVVGSGTSFAQHVADTTHNGYLLSTDWNTFNGKAPLASPAFTGTPTAPTQSAHDNSTNIATTAYVDGAIVTGKLSSIISATSNYNVLSTDEFILCNSTSTITITIPSETDGKKYIVKNINTGNCIVSPSGGQLIEGVASITLTNTASQNPSISFVGYSSAWYVY